MPAWQVTMIYQQYAQHIITRSIVVINIAGYCIKRINSYQYLQQMSAWQVTTFPPIRRQMPSKRVKQRYINNMREIYVRYYKINY